MKDKKKSLENYENSLIRPERKLLRIGNQQVEETLNLWLIKVRATNDKNLH